MKYISVFVTLFLIALANAAGTFAYFELDERFIGKPTRTVLPDGRIHIKLEERVNQPFPEGVKFPATRETGHPSQLEDVLQASPDHYYSVRGEAIMQAHWEVFQLEDHTDADKTICHDRGDKNMRMSIYKPSAQLVEALKTKKESVVLTADVHQHVCHADPIFRVVTEAHFFGDEVLLITAKPSYEALFDEADVALDIKHPQLTHISSAREYVYEEGNDHGVAPHNQPDHESFGASAIPAKADRMHPRDVSEVKGHKINQLNNDLVSEEFKSRFAKKQGLLKKLKKAVKKVVKKVAKTVKKAVSKVTSAVAKGIKSVAKGVWDKVKGIAQMFTLTFEKKMDKSFKASKSYTKTLVGVDFTMDFALGAGFKFHLYIKTAKLKIFHTSVYGSLGFGAGAKLPRKDKSSSGQSMLWDLKGFSLSLVIGVVPVYISYSTRCLAAYTMNAGAEAEAGFRIDASAQFGVEYTSDRGFRMINNKEFKRTHTLKYAASFDAAPSLAIQGRFALYTMVVGYAQINIGLDVLLTTMNPTCNLIKITADFFIQLSAGLDLELIILGKTLFAKNYGPWTIANWKWAMINVCKSKKSGKVLEAAQSVLALPASAEHAHLTELEANHHALPQYNVDGTPVLRDATVLSSDPITALDEDDSGKVWSTDFFCPGTNDTDINVGITGFFQNDTTVLLVVLNRNISVTPDNTSLAYSLASQSLLATVDSAVLAGQTYIFQTLPATNESATLLGIDFEDIEDLVTSAGDNMTAPLNVTSLSIHFDAANMDKITVTSSSVCPAQPTSDVTTLANNKTEPAQPAEGSYFGRLFANFAASLFPAFIRLITDVLVTVLILAMIEFALAYFAPRFISAEHWPKTATTPRTREYTYAAVGVCVGILSMIIFVVGANITFAEITGAQLAPNFTAPVADQGESSYLTASGVQTIVWKFSGASLSLNKCPQYYPCSPDCRDLCVKQTRTWTNAPWPYCPSDTTVQTDNGGCTKFAWDNILNAIFFVLFLTVGPFLAIKKCDTIYRRLPVLHGCLMLAGMFLNLIWRRMDSFMTEVEVQMFGPANEMIIPFDLAMNADSEATWKTACTLYWIMVGAIAVGSAYDIYLFRKDTLEGRMVKFDDTFEADGAADYKKASSSSPVGNNARPRGDTEFNRDVAADLAGLGESEVEPTKTVNDNELSLM